MLNHVPYFSSAYIKNIIVDSITKAFEVDFLDYNNRYKKSLTKMSDNPFIKDRIHERIDEGLQDKTDIIVFANKRGSAGHILVFDVITQRLYSVIQHQRFKQVKKEAIDPDKPAHYVFIYAQVNPMEYEESNDWGLIPLEESQLNEALLSKKKYAHEEIKKYLRNLKPESFTLVVYDMDVVTNSISSIEAFTPSSLNLSPRGEIENWLDHKPVFSLDERFNNEGENYDESEPLIQGLDLKPEIKKQLEDKENVSIEEKKNKMDLEDMD